MARLGWWRIPVWGAAWAAAVPVLLFTLSGVAGRAVPVVAAVAATIAAALLAAFGWGARSEHAAAPRWHVSVLAGGVLLAVGSAAAAAAGALPRAWALLPAGVGAAALIGYHRWTERGLPPGFAFRITGAARACAVAAVGLWGVAAAFGPSALLHLPSRALGGAAYFGIGPLGGGAILWEYVRPGLRAGRRGARGRSAPDRRAAPGPREATVRRPG